MSAFEVSADKTGSVLGVKQAKCTPITAQKCSLVPAGSFSLILAVPPLQLLLFTYLHHLLLTLYLCVGIIGKGLPRWC